MTTYTRARDEYLETEVLTAGPVRRVQILYEALAESVSKAKEAQGSGDIATRARHVNRATGILTELAVSLDHENGGALSKELVELYDYAIRRLIEGSSARKIEPFAEVERLVGTLQDAWKAIPEVVVSVQGFPREQVGVQDRPGEREVVDLVGAGVDQTY